MTSGVLITLIIVGGVVLIAMMSITWLWWATARGGLPSGGADPARLESIEREVHHLRVEVDQLRIHNP